MKNLILIFAIAFLFNSCDKDLFQGNDQLPAATQTGARTVGCLVNGKVFLPHKEGINSPINCFYQPDENGDYYFNITCADFRKSTPIGFSVQNRKSNLVAGNTYILNKNLINNGDFEGGGGNYDIGVDNRYFTNNLMTGELKITKVDLTKGIISGTFWFDAVNDKGEKVEIREGRFDWGFN